MGWRAVFFCLLLLGCGGGQPVDSRSTSWHQGYAESDVPVVAQAADDDQVLVVGEPPTIDKAAWGVQQGVQRLASDLLAIHTDPGDLPRLRIAGERERVLPLEQTHVKARLSGFVADVEVSQTFHNPHRDAIEVVYVFPLPENSAVNAMEMRIGKRVIRARIEERGEAKRIYTRAKQRGHTAALLEQERPNIFTQSVANIAPGEKIDVVIRYIQDLSYDNGSYEFVFPMVVGPRFIPGTTLDAALKGTGTYLDTDRVPDASRITPPYLGKGERSGHDISLELSADNTLPVASFDVPTHEVAVRRPADGSLQLALAEKSSIPNRDFVLRYAVAGNEPIATLLQSGEPREGYFALMVHPPQLDVNELVGKREIIFVVDVSGSMAGVPIGMCKRAMRDAIGRLRPVDTFNIITFAGATAKAFPAPRPANRDSVAQALSFLGQARAGGGTMMADAVGEALSPQVALGRHRYVFFLTDGYIGNEAEIISATMELLEAQRGRGQRARVFGYGVGSSPNRHLLEAIAKAGNGVAVYATTREDPSAGVDKFYRYIDRAVLTDVSLSWGEMGSAETFPNPIPDLFASRPIIVHGRYGQRDAGPLTLRARIGERQVALPVAVRAAASGDASGATLGKLWARAKIEHLEAESWVGMVPDAPAQITELGLRFGLVTPYTSFVAVDASRVVGDGTPETINQWVDVPEGVDGASAGARQHAPNTGVSPRLDPPRVAVNRPMTPPEPSPAPLPAQPSADSPGIAGGIDGERGYGQAFDEEQLHIEEERAASDSPTVAPGVAPPPAERGARGCNCHLVGERDGGQRPWSLAALLALAGAWWWRRRRQ